MLSYKTGNAEVPEALLGRTILSERQSSDGLGESLVLLMHELPKFVAFRVPKLELSGKACRSLKFPTGG